MEERLIDILVSAVCAAHYDTKRNDVCRIFIPGDSRMFDKFEKTLRKRMTARWQEFLLEHGTEAARLAGWDWLHRYLRYQDTVADLYGYVQAGSDIWKQRTDEREEPVFLRDAVVKASCYGAECGAGILAEEGRLVFSEKRRLTGAEERMILDFYRFVLEGIRETFIEILPKARLLVQRRWRRTGMHVRRRLIIWNRKVWTTKNCCGIFAIASAVNFVISKNRW